MTTIMNRKNNLKQGGHASRGYRGNVPRTLKSVISILRSLQPAKTLLTYLLLAVVVSSAYLIASAQSGASSTSDGVEAQAPGFVISGTVRVDDSPDGTSQVGLEGVEIYMSFIPTEVRLDSVGAAEAAILPTETPDFPKLIAVTDERGEYESSFIARDDEGEIHVWAAKDGYQFYPREDVWFHFYGYEEYASNFTAIPEVDATITPTFTPTPTNTPAPLSGLVIFGKVQVDDPALDQSNKGLGGVEIYMAFASYPGNVLAVTDENGGYESDFIEIPVDETVRVWAEKDGYRFIPEEEVWRFYAGTYQERQIDFLAYLDVVTVTPITPTFTPTPTGTPEVTPITPTFTPTPTSTPAPLSGLVIFGWVQVDNSTLDQSGRGLGGVEIYMAFASYPGNVVAITDENGGYESSLIEIPVDETVRVWAEKDGYRFVPDEEVWRFYAGYYQERQIDFLAYPDKVTVTPITPTFTPTSTATPIIITPTSTPTPKPTLIPTDTPTATPEPFQGLVVYGSVRRGGTAIDVVDDELAGFEIYVGIGPGTPILVATTNNYGEYKSGFIPISVSAPINVFAVKDGYSFEPGMYTWAHPVAFEQRKCDFDAYPDVITPTPSPTATSTPVVNPPDKVFDDVPPDHPDAKYIQYLYDRGLVSGCTKVGEPMFCPDDRIKREQVTVILVRAEHPEELGYIPPERESVPFEDMPGTVEIEEGQDPSNDQTLDWRLKWIGEAFDLKLTAGCSVEPSLFCPDKEVSRGQLVTFAVKLRNGQDFVPPEPMQDPFNDVPRYLSNGASYWVAKWAAQGLRDGIVQNCGTDMQAMLFFPDKAATRAEMACMVYHALTSAQDNINPPR